MLEIFASALCLHPEVSAAVFSQWNGPAPAERTSTISWRAATASRESSHFSLFLSLQTPPSLMDSTVSPLPPSSRQPPSYRVHVNHFKTLKGKTEEERLRRPVCDLKSLGEAEEKRRRGAGERSCPSEHLKLPHIQTLPVPKACCGLSERYKHTSSVLLNTSSCLYSIFTPIQVQVQDFFYHLCIYHCTLRLFCTSESELSWARPFHNLILLFLSYCSEN